ncbi:arginine--tRNA ligase [Labrys wisconsinensis]|uniref:Arginine--tRNA ligase n=1 Tax=Labrys wisconsinensis TaxID=425677 RepID=A0ABU0JIK1_9HYPH|nr:arginine--tRNA ligase [Labrys wisconsinensis]MDQ0473099.1 arginyl-tRNA synthetase [Labrys wisconsinensis]
MPDSQEPTLVSRIDGLLEAAFRACGLPTETARAVPGTRPELADLQCNGALPLAKSLGRPPREIAAEVAARLKESDAFASVEVAGPGFINLRLSAGLLAQSAEAQLAAEGAGIVHQTPQRILLDFGGPNVAKPLHVGHLRSLVIGESLRRILSAQGHHALSDVHLGDWGLQMGMLISEIRRRWPDLPCFVPDDVPPGPSLPEGSLPLDMDDLQRLYPEAAAACKVDPERMAEAREATAALQAGHRGYTLLWRALRTISLDAQRRDFDTLEAHFDLLLGESDVQPLIPGMIADLTARGIAVESEGALVIEVARNSDAKPMPPLLLAKSDGAALYATTDLATILDRMRRDAPERIVYVVDQRQALHFEQVFRAAHRAGFADGVDLVHAGFGTVNGPDGKPYKTREGGVAQLADLLSDAIEKAREQVEARERGDGEQASDPIAAEDRETLARLVGLAAVKFADLSTYRTSGYVFDPDRMVSFLGRTGPYVQYACVRIGSILRNAEAQGYAAGAIAVDAPAERALVLECARFPEVVASAAANLAPNEVADYVFGLAQSFSRFYTDCPVLQAESDAVRASRLALSVLARRVLAKGLDLLGIAVPDRM